MSTTKSRIVTVWLDKVSDEHGWIVDTDLAEGGESDTIAVYPPTLAGKRNAIARAEKIAEKRGCELRIQD